MGALGISVVMEVLIAIGLIAVLFMVVSPKDKSVATGKETIAEEEADLSVSSPEQAETAAVALSEIAVPDREEGESEIVDPPAVSYRLSRSFTAKLILSEEAVKERYSEIKNALLSYKKVKARMSRKCETFRKGRTVLAKLSIRGKTLCLYLALYPHEVPEGRIKVESASKRSVNTVTPTMYKIRSAYRVKKAKQLIALLSEKYGLIAVERQAENYAPAYRTEEELFEQGLIKKVKSTRFIER